MTSTQYRSALKRLGLSQAASARFFGVSSVTARRWAREGQPPKTVELLIYLMTVHDWTPKFMDESYELYRWAATAIDQAKG